MDPIDAALAALELQDPPNYTQTVKEFNINYFTLLRCYWQITYTSVTEPHRRGLHRRAPYSRVLSRSQTFLPRLTLPSR